MSTTLPAMSDSGRSGAVPAALREPVRSQGRIGGLIRFARRLVGRSRGPVSVAFSAAVPVATAAVRQAAPMARPVVRAAAPALRAAEPITQPLLRAVQPAFALAPPLIRLTAQERPVVALREAGRDIEPAELARRHGPAATRIVVLVPASGQDETLWRRGQEHTGSNYPARLGGALGWSPVNLRYDSGHAPGAAALALSALLQRLLDVWPIAPERIVLLAHGDGGLLARGALGVHNGALEPWGEKVSELIALGSPHLATTDPDLTRGLGRRLDEALAGIVIAGPELIDVPALDHVDYLLVSDRPSAHPLGRRFGDLLWWRHRVGRGGRRVHDLFPTAERFELPPGPHPLSNHPQVHDALLRWLV